jgi:hypothetical protein
VSVTTIPEAIHPAILRACEAAWPDPTWNGWHRYKGTTADKYGSLHHSLIPRACMVALDALAAVVANHIGDSFIDYDLHAAGLHMMPPGGFLGRHLDAERHPIRPWRRTHSIVMPVNSAWGELCGGELVIESNLDSEPDQVFEVLPGRVVIFETPNIWHKVNRVGTDISKLHRKSLALFAWQLDDECEGKTSADFRE